MLRKSAPEGVLVAMADDPDLPDAVAAAWPQRPLSAAERQARQRAKNNANRRALERILIHARSIKQARDIAFNALNGRTET